MSSSGTIEASLPQKFDPEPALLLASQQLDQVRQRAFVAIATRMIERFRENEWRGDTPLPSRAELFMRAIRNAATAAGELQNGDAQRAIERAADAANLLALMFEAEA